jgi:predicted trehalose synthase
MLAAATAGCDHGDGGSTFQHLSVVDANHVAVHARSGPDAIVSSDGALEIGGQAVMLTSAQQTRLKQYFDAAVLLHDDALATGAAGLATAGTAIGSVVAGLASGDTDSIDAKVEAQAAKVEARAAKVCADLTELYATQQAVAESIDAFRPYATIDAQAPGDCRP